MLALRHFAYCCPMRAVGYVGQALSPEACRGFLGDYFGL